MMKRMMEILVIVAMGLSASAAEPAAPSAKTGMAAERAVSGEVATLLSSGRECLLSGKWTEAVALFEKARSLDSGNQEAAFGLSAAFIELKRYSDALPLLEKLAKDLPEHPMVKNNLAWVLLQDKDKTKGSGNAPRAIKLARSAMLDVPSDYSIWNTLGEAYYVSGQFDKALRAAECGLRLSVLAGLTNSPCKDLVVRCRKAAAAASLDKSDGPDETR